MPKKSWINKKTAQHFTLVHRPQNDPLIHDDSAPSMILNPTNVPGSSKPSSKHLDDLASELGVDAENIRANEGEAANYGIYYDDTEYDYMQHMRDLGDGPQGGSVTFVEADATGSNRNKGKGKSLEAALKQLDIQADEAKKRELFDDDFLPSKNLKKYTYQDMQEVPDAIGGFQPDMDPRIREALEALEDEAYVDNGEDDDFFQTLTKDGDEVDEFDFEDMEDEGWETDDTAKPGNEYKAGAKVTDSAEQGDEVPDLVPALDVDEAAEAADTVNWMEDFKAFKKDQKITGSRKLGAPPSQADLQSSILSTTTNGGRRKKRKGALTDASSYSMTSSSLVRTEQLGILDARFDKLEQEYQPDFDDMGSVSAISTTSTVDGPIRGDFDSVLDDFLDGHSTFNKKYIRKDWTTGTQQLDEIRRELGPARLKGKTKSGKVRGAK